MFFKQRDGCPLRGPECDGLLSNGLWLASATVLHALLLVRERGDDPRYLKACLLTIRVRL